MPPFEPANRPRISAMTLRRRALLLLAPALLLPACGRKKPAATRVPAGAAVLALGDSLTWGTGATPETSFPAVLAKLTGWQITNAGVPGDTAEQALQRLPALLAEHKPQLVIVSIGGNDFLRRLPEDGTRRAIRAICEQAKVGGAQVLLVAVPALTASAVLGRLSDHALYADLARELKLPLYEKGWSTVLSNANLRSDRIHANAEGYAAFAQGLDAFLRQSGLL